MLRNELLIFFPQREFWSGEEVKGYAELRLPFPMPITQVNLEFFGREFIEVGGKKEFNQFLHVFSQLEGPGSKVASSGVVKGVLSNITSLLSGSKTQVEQVPAGSHRYPFTFKIPDVVPPSYTTPNGGHIDYELRVTVVTSGQGMSNLVSSARLPVAGSLFDMNLLGNTSTPFQVKENKSFFMARSTLDIVCNFESRVFLTGDAIRINMDINNHTTKSVTGFTVKLVQKIDILGKTPKSDEYMLASHTIGDIEGKQEKHPNVQLLVPTTAVESVFPKEIGKNAGVGKIVQVSYSVKLHANVSMATDLDIAVPIYIVGRARHEQLVSAHAKQFPHLYQQQQQPQQHVSQMHHMPMAPPVSDVFQQPQSQYYPQQQYQQPHQTSPYQQAPPQQQQYQQAPQQPYQTQPLPQQQYPQQHHQYPQQTQQSAPQQPYQESGMYPTTTSFYPSVDNNQRPVTSPVLPPIPIEAYENAARRQIEQENKNNDQLLLDDHNNLNMQAQPSYDEFFE